MEIKEVSTLHKALQHLPLPNDELYYEPNLNFRGVEHINYLTFGTSLYKLKHPIVCLEES